MKAGIYFCIKNNSGDDSYIKLGKSGYFTRAKLLHNGELICYIQEVSHVNAYEGQADNVNGVA